MTTNIDIIQSISPYTPKEVARALKRLVSSDRFVEGIQYFYPHWSADKVRVNLKECASCADFQVTFIEPIIRNIIDQSIDELEVIGLDSVKKEDSFLYISNHRDIFLDSGLLQYSLYHNQLPFTEISLGDNLMIDKLVETVAKMNNMFTVYRSGNKSEILRNARRLSAYLHYAISKKKVSAWIAQGNGRAKNGDDKTSPGLLNMLLINSKGDYEKIIKDLNIMVSTVSYEYEPCALEKAIERQAVAEEGSYVKSKYEDIQSILKGIEEYKGNVKMVFEKLDIKNIDFSANRKIIVKQLTAEIDNTMYKNYQLWKTNYMAYDYLNGVNAYKAHYTSEEEANFKTHLQQITTRKDLQDRILEIYAKPIENVLGSMAKE